MDSLLAGVLHVAERSQAAYASSPYRWHADQPPTLPAAGAGAEGHALAGPYMLASWRREDERARELPMRAALPPTEPSPAAMAGGTPAVRCSSGPSTRKTAFQAQW